MLHLGTLLRFLSTPSSIYESISLLKGKGENKLGCIASKIPICCDKQLQPQINLVRFDPIKG